MLDAIGAGATTKQNGIWAQIWVQSDEYRRVTEEIETICVERASETVDFAMDENEYAVSLITQLAMVTRRTFTSYWRDPNYLLGKYVNLFQVITNLGLFSMSLRGCLTLSRSGCFHSIQLGCRIDCFRCS
jgi:hypothetical protein